MPTQVDLYELLGVARDASADDIRRAYRKLARQYHPDVNPDPAAVERFKEVNLPTQVLSDPDKRRQYDAYGTTGGPSMGGGSPFGGGGFGSINDIFDFFFSGGGGFGGMGGQRQNRDYEPGEHLQRAVHLKLEDVLADKPVELTLDRRELCEQCQGSRSAPGSQPVTCQTCGGRGVVLQIRDTLLGRIQTTTTCPHCRGEGLRITDPCKACGGTGLTEKRRTISVTIPAGIDDGNVLKVRAEGHQGRGGAPHGDLLVRISIEPHAFFHRDGADLHCETSVHYSDLVLGATVMAPTLTGQEQLRIPAGTGSHHEFTLRGHGLPRLRHGGRGNLYVRVVLAVPGKAGKEQRELLSKLKEADLAADQRAGGFFKNLLKGK
jgi:molecular chaperone DnaJ